jgi:KaiC/GvpD/RAD55 family RecA-like ATPase
MGAQAHDHNPLLAAALEYASWGWPVLPLHTVRDTACSCGREGCQSPAKHPRTQHGLKEASTDVDVVAEWWQRWPSANVGLRTGIAFDVLDIDLGGEVELERLEREHGSLPEGPVAITGSGGRHQLFVPTGGGNRAGIWEHADFRGQGGYIVAAPSSHVSGLGYSWLTGPDQEIPAMPSWLRALAAPPKETRPPGAVKPLSPAAGDGTNYGMRGYEAEISELGAAPVGMRNHQLNRIGFSLYQLVAGGELDEGFVTAALWNTARAIGLGDDEIKPTVDSAYKAGMASPRSAPPLRLVEGKQPPRASAPRDEDVPPDDEGPQAVPDGDHEPGVEAEYAIKRPFNRVAIDLRAPLPPVEILVRYLYAGCLTVLQSEPGVGKSWLAAWLSLHVMETGRAVIYIDEEGGPELISERLQALGADPDLVAEQFHYFAFEGRAWGWDDIMALEALIASIDNLSLAVLDSLPDFLAAAAKDEDRASDVTAFIANVCGRFRSAGCAQLLLDHLPKPPTEGRQKRSRYSRGSGAKLAKADATLLLESVDEFDTETSGKLKLWKTKDRRGRLALPALSKAGRELIVTVGNGTLAIAESDRPEKPAWDGPTDCMAKVTEWLSTHHGEHSKRQIETGVRAAGHGFRREVIIVAVERLAESRAINHRRGPRNSDLYSRRSGDDVRTVDSQRGLDWDPLDDWDGDEE